MHQPPVSFPRRPSATSCRRTAQPSPASLRAIASPSRTALFGPCWQRSLRRQATHVLVSARALRRSLVWLGRAPHSRLRRPRGAPISNRRAPRRPATASGERSGAPVAGGRFGPLEGLLRSPEHSPTHVDAGWAGLRTGQPACETQPPPRCVGIVCTERVCPAQSLYQRGQDRPPRGRWGQRTTDRGRRDQRPRMSATGWRAATGSLEASATAGSELRVAGLAQEGGVGEVCLAAVLVGLDVADRERVPLKRGLAARALPLLGGKPGGAPLFGGQETP